MLESTPKSPPLQTTELIALLANPDVLRALDARSQTNAGNIQDSIGGTRSDIIVKHPDVPPQVSSGTSGLVSD